MSKSSKQSRFSAAGFTLVEIAIAVAILGLAFTTLIGLHTKMLNTYGVEKNRNIAAMIGQYMLAMIEVAPLPPQVGSDTGKLKSKLQDLGYFDADNEKWKLEDLDDWEFTQTVVSEGLGEIDDVYRRIELKISWNDGAEDSFDLVYFVFTRSYRGGSLGDGGGPFGGGSSGGGSSGGGSVGGGSSGGVPFGGGSTGGSPGIGGSPSGLGNQGTNPSGFDQSNPYEQLLNAN